MSKKLDAILDERQEDYGDAETNFTAIGRIWGALLQIEDIPAYQVALMMVQFKTVRASANPYKADSWDDLEGYTHHGRNLILGKSAEVLAEMRNRCVIAGTEKFPEESDWFYSDEYESWVANVPRGIKFARWVEFINPRYKKVGE